MINEEGLRKRVAALIEDEKEREGTYKAVAKKCGISNSTLFYIRTGKWENLTPSMLLYIKSKLDGETTEWGIVETTNLKKLKKLCADAQKEMLWVAVSHCAGSGKSASLEYIAKSTPGVYYLRCHEWAKREFAANFMIQFGLAKSYISMSRNYSVDDLLNKIIKFFVDRVHESPLIIIDEADKLRDSALRLLIPLFNELEDKLALLLSGTENLEKELKAGVRNNRKGFDEIDSRLGRNFIHLIGSTKKDVAAICMANGIMDTATCSDIFDEAEPIIKMLDTASGKKPIKVVEDLRRVKRIIKRYKIQNERNNTTSEESQA